MKVKTRNGEVVEVESGKVDWGRSDGAGSKRIEIRPVDELGISQLRTLAGWGDHKKFGKTDLKDIQWCITYKSGNFDRDYMETVEAQHMLTKVYGKFPRLFKNLDAILDIRTNDMLKVGFSKAIHAAAAFDFSKEKLKDITAFIRDVGKILFNDDIININIDELTIDNRTQVVELRGQVKRALMADPALVKEMLGGKKGG